MTPFERYQQDLNLGGITHDAQQEAAIRHLDAIYHELTSKKWVNYFKKNHSIKGLYLWGSVGIGKTYVMDTFYAALPEHLKMRQHFHHFMRDLQQQLKQKQGKKDPLKEIADDLAKQIRVLCFDEFFVSDIADAMILANLFTVLFKRGVCLVATSNVAPDDLYKNGLQRASFLPAIALIKNYTAVMHLTTEYDYRLRSLEYAGSYFFPLDTESEAKLREHFALFARTGSEGKGVIEIEGRFIDYVRKATRVIWFDFKVLCSIPRSQNDYLELARQFPVILLSNVPKIAADQEATIVYLIHLVDIFYDMGVKLIISAEVSMQELYREGRYCFEFQRTLSRLIEMQSQEYFRSPHRVNQP